MVKSAYEALGNKTADEVLHMLVGEFGADNLAEDTLDLFDINHDHHQEGVDSGPKSPLFEKLVGRISDDVIPEHWAYSQPDETGKIPKTLFDKKRMANYLSLSGEVMSRMVEDRYGISEEERAMVPLEQTPLFFGSGKDNDGYPSDRIEIRKEDDGAMFSLAGDSEDRKQTDSAEHEREAEDRAYLDAVERGDMETAQRMVNEAAKRAGYSSKSDYQGTSAFNGAAPYGNGYYMTKKERKDAWDNDEWDGYSSLGDYIDNGVDGGNIEELTNRYSYRSADAIRKEAIENLRDVIENGKKTITMYRSVPSSVKEGSFRNGDWVTPSKKYAIENAEIHGWDKDYRIIKQEVPVDDVWFDGNDIAEFGYGRETDFINDKDFAYKNTENNRKLLEAVTYDNNGNVIPLSERFNENNSDTRFSLAGGGKQKADTKVLDGKIKKVKADKSLDEKDRDNALKRLEQQKAVCESHLPKKSGLTLGFGKKKGMVNVTNFVSKPASSHLVLEGIHYENGFAVVSDNKCLVVARQDYPRSIEGKTIQKDGTEVDQRFPDWERVIDSNSTKARGEFDTADFIQALQRAADAPGEFKKAYLKQFPDASDKNVRTALKSFRDTPILDLPEKTFGGSEQVLGFDADKAKQILNFIKEIGGDVKIGCGSINITVEGNGVFAIFTTKSSWDRELSDDRLADDEWFFKNYDTRYSGKYQRYGQENSKPKKGKFGTIYEQFKGKAKEAVAWLMQKKEGEAVGALHHKDVGDIDLVWGKEGTGKSDGFGLAKLVKYHPEVVGNLQEILDSMEVKKRTKNRVQLESDTHQASVRLTWDDTKKSWLLTAFEKKKEEKNSASNNSTDTVETADGGKRNDTATPQSTVPDGKDTQDASEKQAENDGSENSVVAQKQAEAATAPQTEAVEESKDEQAPDTEAGSGGGGANVPPAEPAVPSSPEEKPRKPSGETEPQSPAAEPNAEAEKTGGELPEDASVDDIKAEINRVKDERAAATKEYLSGQPHSEQARDKAAQLRGRLNELNAQLAEAKRAEKKAELDAKVKDLREQRKKAIDNGDYKEAQKIGAKIAATNKERKRSTLRGQYEAKIAEIIT